MSSWGWPRSFGGISTRPDLASSALSDAFRSTAGGLTVEFLSQPSAAMWAAAATEERLAMGAAEVAEQIPTSCEFGRLQTSGAIDRSWAVSVTFGVIGLLNAALLWAFRRQLQRGQRDVLPKVIMVGGVIFIFRPSASPTC